MGIISKNKEEKKRLAEYEEKLRKYEARIKSEDDVCRIHMINPDRICPNPCQPREYFDDGELIALADSIRQYGIIQPLAIRRLSAEDSPFGGLYELIAGERRLRAAKMLSMPYVPCMIIEADGEQSAQLAIVENLHRADLNMFEEANAIASLCGKYGLRQEDAARLLSVSQSYIANKLRLLRLTESERHDILNSGLSERHARALVKLTDERVRSDALRVIIGKGMNVHAAEEYIASVSGQSPNEQMKGNRKIIIRDIRIFLNTIEHAVILVKQAGIPVEQSRCDDGDTIELKIRMPAALKGVVK